MSFRELQGRLLATLKARLQSGEMSERRLAQLIGISQPHMHNVLKGYRILSPEIADHILQRLKIPILELFPVEEVRRTFCVRCGERSSYCDVPVLEGWVGPGLPVPVRVSSLERYPFQTSYLSSIDRPVLARLAADSRMAESVRAQDLALLDRSVSKRTHPAPDGLYMINRRGEGIIRRVIRADPVLYLLDDDSLEQPGPCDVILLAETDVLDIVWAKVVWLGRYLEGN